MMRPAAATIRRFLLERPRYRVYDLGNGSAPHSLFSIANGSVW